MFPDTVADWQQLANVQPTIDALIEVQRQFLDMTFSDEEHEATDEFFTKLENAINSAGLYPTGQSKYQAYIQTLLLD